MLPVENPSNTALQLLVMDAECPLSIFNEEIHLK